jgi:2-polyprenyl-3-methyl-5-hydroxy-6-metoxy-1,4-benzoquinol methylase
VEIVSQNNHTGSHLTNTIHKPSNKPRLHLDPVAAYDLIAWQFAAISNRRKPYLDAIDDLIVNRIPAGSKYLLDVGAGDGSRARKISSLAKIESTVLLEPSSVMSRKASGGQELWAVRAEDLVISEETPRFDVVTCLWNVLGHIRPAAARLTVLCKLRDLLIPGGRIFVDVTHRYNVRSYGAWITCCRFLKDVVMPREENGDVTARWSLPEVECSTYGHVFTNREILRLAREAGLKVEACLPVDYETGVPTRFLLQGNLLYELTL